MRRALAFVVAVLFLAGSPAAASEPRPKGEGAAADACTWLVEEDFRAAGLQLGRAKRESGLAGPGCTWDPVLGRGGFLNVSSVSAQAYAKGKARAGAKAVAVPGLGDDAYVTKGLAGDVLVVRRGERGLRLSGNARLTREQLVPLARAALARMP